MARITGLEPVTSCVTGKRSSQLNYIRELVRHVGFEPTTFGLRVRYSSQLS